MGVGDLVADVGDVDAEVGAGAGTVAPLALGAALLVPRPSVGEAGL